MARDNRPTLVTILWRDIPSHVNAQAGRTRHQAPLTPRFQVAIDRAAMIAGLTISHDYVREWRRVAVACDDDLAIAASTEAARLEADWSDERLGRVAESGGFDDKNNGIG